MKNRNRNFLLISYFANTFGFSLFVPLYAAFIVQLGQSPERASFLWAIYTLIFGASVVTVGRIQDRLAKKSYTKLLVLGYFLRLCATLLFIIGVTHFHIFASALIIYGFGSALLTPAWFSIFSRQSTKHVALNFSLSEGGGALFSASGAAAGGLLFAIGGYEYIFYCMAIMHLVGLIASSFVTYRNN